MVYRSYGKKRSTRLVICNLQKGQRSPRPADDENLIISQHARQHV